MSARKRRVRRAVTASLDRLVETADSHDGMIPSILDASSGELCHELPPPVAGQRGSDRAFLGGNVLHDEPLLQAMYGLATAGVEKYLAPADRYLERFVTRCTQTTTGLFPWGEHAYWHVEEDRIGNAAEYYENDYPDPACATHDHLRQAPVWLWSKLQSFDPACSRRFADGLDHHFVDTAPLDDVDTTPFAVVEEEYNRHAPIEDDRPAAPWIDDACDFPRHSGFCLLDAAVAYATHRHPDDRERVLRFSGYWWQRRDLGVDGLLPLESRGQRDYELAADQTLSLAASHFDAAAHLHSIDTDLSGRLRSRGERYLDAFLDVPHDPEAGVVVGTIHEADFADRSFETRTGPEVTQDIVARPLWAAGYGNPPAAQLGLLALGVYRHTGREDLLDFAESVGRQYRGRAPPGPDTRAADLGLAFRGSTWIDPDDTVNVPAMVPGLVIDLLADLRTVTGDAAWYDGALSIAAEILDSYLDTTLPRGATGIDWYESQLGTGHLLHALARIGWMDDDADPIGPNYAER